MDNGASGDEGVVMPKAGTGRGFAAAFGAVPVASGLVAGSSEVNVVIAIPFGLERSLAEAKSSFGP